MPAYIHLCTVLNHCQKSCGVHAAHRTKLTSVIAGYTNAGVLAALATLFAAFSRPSLLAVPYALAVAAAVWRWGRGHEANVPRALLRAGQLYTGVAETLQAVSETREGWRGGGLPVQTVLRCIDSSAHSFEAFIRGDLTPVIMFDCVCHKCHAGLAGLTSQTGVVPCAALHVALLYLWQIDLLRLDHLTYIARTAGLYVISADLPASDLVPQVRTIA